MPRWLLNRSQKGPSISSTSSKSHDVVSEGANHSLSLDDWEDADFALTLADSNDSENGDLNFSVSDSGLNASAHMTSLDTVA